MQEKLNQDWICKLGKNTYAHKDLGAVSTEIDSKKKKLRDEEEALRGKQVKLEDDLQSFLALIRMSQSLS